VPFLADDRHLARLGHEELSELLQLGGRRVAAGEDAEVDADLQARGCCSTDECDGFLDLHLQVV
jgi:hypothetical protein